MPNWKFSHSRKYERDYRILPDEVQKRVDQALIQLARADSPTKYGRHKYADWNCVYSYDIGKKYRILYEAYHKEETIFLHRVGTHAVYD